MPETLFEVDLNKPMTSSWYWGITVGIPISHRLLL